MLLTMVREDLQPGLRVRYQRKDMTETATVVAIDRGSRRGDLFGRRVDRLAWADRECAFLTLDIGYCYGWELL